MTDQPAGTGHATTTTAPPAATAPGSPSTEPDWTDQVSDLIVDSVDKVRDRTTGPVLEYSRMSVHAVVALILLLPIGALFLVGVVRLLNWAIPGDVWIVYAGLGTFFLLVGVALWSRRSKLPI
ncbi:MAG: hypothetical protein ACYC2O_13370 [Microthrixaceae bacterium]